MNFEFSVRFLQMEPIIFDMKDGQGFVKHRLVYVMKIHTILNGFNFNHF